MTCIPRRTLRRAWTRPTRGGTRTMERHSPILEVRRVTKRFPGVLALDDVSVELQPGEVHALVGENGAGKSTLIKVITGVYRPDEGQVLFNGEEVSFADPRESQAAGISTIYQEINLIPLLSGAQNVFLGREPRNSLGLIDRARMNRQASEILERYGIHADGTAPLRSLGLGVQQMVAIARAISVDAGAVIMDEPTSSLEAREVETLFGVIRQLRQEGVGVIYVSHRLEELYEICDRVTVLRDGRVAHTGELSDLSRLQLIAHMLGRELDEVRKEGATGFGEEHEAAEEPILQAQDLTQHPRLREISLDVRPGEVVGLAGLLGAGRTETAKAIFGAEPVDSGSVRVGGENMKMGSPAAAIKAGIAFLPEDRKSEGIIPDLSVKENIVAAALPRLARAGMVSEKAQDELVVHEPEGAHPRRAHARHRRWSEGGDTEARRRSRSEGAWRHSYLLGARRSHGGQRSRGRPEGWRRGRDALRGGDHRGQPDGDARPRRRFG